MGSATGSTWVDFDICAFHAEFDRVRQGRGVTWAEVARQISAPFAHRRDIPPVSPSTLSGMASRSGLNGNIVMSALRWMGEQPESFVAGTSKVGGTPIPDLGPRHLLRWDTKALYAAVDGQRQARGLSWAQVAREVGLPVGVVKGIVRSVGFPFVMRFTRWVDRPAASFMTDVPV